MADDIKEPEDDATIVNDEQTPEEKDHDDLVAKVAKMTGRDEWGDDSVPFDADKPADEPADSAEATTETPSEEGEIPALSDALQARAEKAGLNKELAERLHQSGQLEETLAAFDRTMVERFQAEPAAKPETKPERQEPVEQDQDEEWPDLDPEVYDEEIVKRDRYYKQQFAQQQELIESLLNDRQEAFEQWFDGTLSEMGYDINDEQKCQKTFAAYKGLCEAHGVSPESRNKDLAERAHAAMFPEDVKKKTQQETVDRLRDAEGKFLPSSKPKGAPPAKDLTPEEADRQLLTGVTAYLKEQGVQMSGY